MTYPFFFALRFSHDAPDRLDHIYPGFARVQEHHPVKCRHVHPLCQTAGVGEYPARFWVIGTLIQPVHTITPVHGIGLAVYVSYLYSVPGRVPLFIFGYHVCKAPIGPPLVFDLAGEHHGSVYAVGKRDQPLKRRPRFFVVVVWMVDAVPDRRQHGALVKRHGLFLAADGLLELLVHLVCRHYGNLDPEIGQDPILYGIRKFESVKLRAVL